MNKKTFYAAQKELLKSRPNISDQLKALMRHHKLTQTKLSNATGISIPSIQHILKTAADVRASMSTTLAQYFTQTQRQILGLDPLNLENSKINTDMPPLTTRIPYIEWDDALTFVLDKSSRPENFSPENSIANDRKLSKNAFALKVKPFMSVFYSPRAIFLVDPDEKITDGLALVTLDGVSVDIKKITLAPDKILLEDINETGLKERYDEEKHRILGMIIEFRMQPPNELNKELSYA